MADDGSKQTLDRIRQAAEDASTRSPLYRWMWENHDAFAEIVNVTRPNWQRIAAEFAALGILNGRGQPLSAGVVRQTWARVRRRYALDQAKKKRFPRSSGGHPPVAGPLPSVVREVFPADAGVNRKPALQIKLTKLAGSDEQ